MLCDFYWNFELVLKTSYSDIISCLLISLKVSGVEIIYDRSSTLKIHNESSVGERAVKENF